VAAFSDLLARIAPPAAVLLGAVVAADRFAPEPVAFLLCLAGLLVCAASGVAALGHVVDGAAGRAGAVVSAGLSAVFLAAALARSPEAAAVPWLSNAALVAGFVLCGVVVAVARR
jgi:hypothetical protein